MDRDHDSDHDSDRGLALDLDVDVPRAVLVALVVVVGAALIVGGATSGAAFDAFNLDWDGTSDLRETADAAGSEPVVVRNTTEYADYGEGDLAVVLSPDREYGEDDATRVREFVHRGGTLVVAERDGPHGSALLEAVGAEARPEGPILRDERHHHRDPALPIATEVGNHSLVAEGAVESLTLNYGTAVEPGDATVLVASSSYAYLDLDGSGEISDDETARSYPVATIEEVGDGHVIVVGDPSVFINVMQDDLGNRAFVAALADGTNHTLVDVSHGSSPPPLMAILLSIRGSTLLQLGLGVGAILAVAAASRVADRRVASRRATDQTSRAGAHESVSETRRERG